MLKSVLQVLRQHQLARELCAETGGGKNYFTLAQNGLFQKPAVHVRNYVWHAVLLSLIPKKLRRRFGIVLESEVEVILDGSGFGYGDFWKRSDNKRYIRRIGAVKRKGGHVILLPQALGPFTKPDVREEFGQIVDQADLIFARDRLSYQYLIDAYGERDCFRSAPDFTNKLVIEAPRAYADGNVCVIPNSKMTTVEKYAGEYVDFLLRSVHQIQQHERFNPYFLVHEGQKDFAICEQLNTQLEKPLAIVWPADPVEVKDRIRSVHFTLVSRFHGLVSSLSQGVPAIATSWSHKYQMLMEDYHCEDFLVHIGPSEEEKVASLIDSLADDSQYSVLKNKLGAHSLEQKQRTDAMWTEVLALIERA